MILCYPDGWFSLTASTFNQLDQYASVMEPAVVLLCRTRCLFPSCGCGCR